MVASTPEEWRRVAQAFFQQGDLAGAADAFNHSFGPAGPQSALDFLSLSRFAIFMGAYAKAGQYCDQALTLAPGHPEILLTRARIDLFLGNVENAGAVIQEGLASAPDHPMLLYQALELVRPLPQDLLDHARSVAAGMDTPTLLFGVARALDRAGAYDRAWAAASQANRQQKAISETWSRQNAEKQLQCAIELFTALGSTSTTGDLQPIYLTGSPRCGGTLLETLISAPGDVGSAGERGALIPWLINASKEVGELGIERAAENFASKCADLAKADSAGLRSIGVTLPEFTDKTPANADVAGLLARIHPRAQFVDVDRDRRDTAISIFFHEFPSGYPYSTDINSIAEYLAFRRAAISAWEDAGLRFVRVKYGDFVAEPETEGARIFKELGLEWSPEFLSPKARSAPARTFSATAVRESINTRKSGSWQRYEKYVGRIEP